MGVSLLLRLVHHSVFKRQAPVLFCETHNSKEESDRLPRTGINEQYAVEGCLVPAMLRPERSLVWIFSALLLIGWIVYFTHGGWFAAESSVRGSAPAGADPRTGVAQTRNREIPNAKNGGPHMIVYITGAVKRPGLYRLPLDARVETAIQAAGGATLVADLAAINLAAVLEDGTQVVVPESVQVTAASPVDGTVSQTVGATEPSTGTIPIQVPARHRHQRKKKLQPGERININQSDLLILEEIPGIGLKKARAILSYRSAHGLFSSLVQLRFVHGIGPKLLEKIRAYVTL